MKLLVIAALGLLSGTGRASTPETYDIDPVHSFAVFKIKHLNLGYVWGRINGPMGSIVVDEADVSRSSVSITLKTENIDTHNKDRDQHLRSPEFFNVQQFPTLTFKSTSIRKSGENAFEVVGLFTLLGKPKEISVLLRRVGSGQDPWGHHRTGFDGAFTIKRSEFGMTHMPDGIGDDVQIFLSVEGVRKGAPAPK